MSNDKTDQQTSLPPLSECMSKDSVVIADGEQAAEFIGLKIRMIELITELSAAVRMLEDQPQLAQRLSITLNRSERLLQRITKRYRDIEMLRVKIYLSVSLRKAVIRYQDREKRKNDDEKGKEHQRLQEKQFQSEIDEYNDLEKNFLQSCQDLEHDARGIQEDVHEIMDTCLHRSRLMVLLKMRMPFFCSWFVMMVASNFERILQAAGRGDL